MSEKQGSHLVSRVRRTYSFVYKKGTGQGTLDGVDLDEQAEKLCPHFAELKDVFDNTTTFKIKFTTRAIIKIPLWTIMVLLDHVEHGIATQDVKSEELLSEAHDNEDAKGRSSNEPSSKKQMVVDKKAQSIQRFTGQLLDFVTKADNSEVSRLLSQIELLENKLDSIREEHKK
ncbi:hypothetical protein BGW38_003843 [Lunasporangiospora selenospora]|uniref:Uncharacterized protein n=1 Tax=Lunasporangiospora selenospora TaxID=979761 RepID=A0A9P6FQ23_9FUNG|nr:hypothetical protein BGW38_003843 [Lunasporangiospora selenospora]